MQKIGVLINLDKIAGTGYWSDFYVYPMTILIFIYIGFNNSSTVETIVALPLLILGFISWTFIEYVVHRFLFHKFAFLKRIHDLHHEFPIRLIGNPTYISLPIYIVFMFLPLYLMSNISFASFLFSGFLIGALFYFIIHHSTHHIRTKKGSILFFYKKYHALHHHDEKTNFAVTLPIWDSLFKTKK